MNVKKMLLLLVFSGLLFLSCKTKDQDISYKFDSSSIYLLDLAFDINLSRSFAMSKSDSKYFVSMGLKFEPSDNAAGNSNVFDVSFTSLKYIEKSGEIAYDSDIDSSKKGGVANILGSSFKVSIKKSGEITMLNGFDDIMQTVFTAYLPKSSAKSVSSQFGSNFLKQILEQVLWVKHDGLVAKNDSWENSATYKRGIPSKTISLLKIEENKKNEITIEREFESSVGEFPMKMSYANYFFKDTEGNQSGVLKFDPITNWISKGEFKSEIKFTVSVKNSQGKGLNYKYKADVKTTVSGQIKKL